MGGGLLQIAAYGAQDVYLTGDPQITFFKVVYKRHTNFSMESIQQHFSGKIGFGKSDISTTISRNGDLVNAMYLQVTLPQCPMGWSWIDSVGHRLIKSVRINLGGDNIDEHNGKWLEIWDQLTHDATSKDAYSMMTGKNGLTGFTDGGRRVLYIPLQFWFNRNPGLSLPLIALQYHEVKVVFDFEDLQKLVKAPATGKWGSGAQNDYENGGPYGSNTAQLTTANVIADQASASAWQTTLSALSYEFKADLYVDYIYLDTEERKRFSQMSHEYLIDQLQIQGRETITSYNHRCKLNFNHPVKELVWVFEPPENPGNGTGAIDPKYAHGYYSGVDNEDYFKQLTEVEFGHFGQTALTGGAVHSWLKDAKLQINGHDRFTSRPGEYFSRVQPWQHHSGSPSVPIYVYSFALRPEDFQPSGTCNFSRIDNSYLEVNLNKLLGDHAYDDDPNVAFVTPTETGGAAANSLKYANPAYYAKTASTATGQTVGALVGGDVGWQVGDATKCGYYKLPTSSSFVSGKSLNMYVYAVSYNVLKIVSGRGGLAYSN
tara:strand:+ start:6360 stop:7991 length:1632 start_codon:yes stop_codon:yes gene_type:complete